MRYTLNIKDGKSTLTVFTDEGNIVTLDGEHPNYKDAWAAVQNNDLGAFMAQADVLSGIKQAFESVTTRVTIEGNNLYLDGEKIDGRLADTIIDFRRKGENYLPLVRFIERLGANPSMRSRDQLYTWLAERNFTITPSGKFIAYKGVSAAGDGKFMSHFAGRASVNGVEQNGQIVQGIGDVVTMPRPKVNDNADIGCSQGLHAGTWEYASTFGNGYTLTVEIDPANVVSVPSDCSFQKLRVCEYRITGAAEIPYSERVVADYDEDEGGEGEEYCEGCGSYTTIIHGCCDYCGDEM
jgi:hypothetical protein